MLYMSTIGAVGGFVAYTYALGHLPVSFVSLYAYINPVIAVALGVLVLHEPFTVADGHGCRAGVCRCGRRERGGAARHAPGRSSRARGGRATSCLTIAALRINDVRLCVR
jgi:hypothetical protein